MRVFILLVAALTLFAPFVELSGSNEESPRDSEVTDVAKPKRKYVRKNQAGGSSSSSAAPTLATTGAPQKGTKRKNEHPEIVVLATEAAAATVTSPRGRPKNSAKKLVIEVVDQLLQPAQPAFNKEELLSLLDTSTSARVNFISKFESIGVSNIPAGDASDLLVAAIDKGKESLTKFIISMGVKLDLSTVERKNAAGKALFKAIAAKKIEFLANLIDFDPETSVKLFGIVMNLSVDNAIVLEAIKTVLTKSSATIDPEAIQHLAECAADAKLIDLVLLLLESDVLTRMISARNLVTVFSDLKQFSEPKYNNLLRVILNDRLITPPFAVNILLQAAEDNKMDFIDAVEPHLNLFSWAVVIKALEICLRKRHFYFADILLRTNTYSVSDFAFRLCSRDAFLDSIAKYASNEILGRLVNATYYENTTLLLSDDCLRKICVGACYAGNVEVIDFLIFNNYFDLQMRFKRKSIFRMALESGNSNLAKYLIKYYGTDLIFSSDTPHYNPTGDSLIYVALNDQIDTFKYLLKLGANPEVFVRYDETHVIKLIYWCIENGHDLIVKVLLEAGCEIEIGTARHYNKNPQTTEKIEVMLMEFQDRQN